MPTQSLFITAVEEICWLIQEADIRDGDFEAAGLTPEIAWAVHEIALAVERRAEANESEYEERRKRR